MAVLSRGARCPMSSPSASPHSAFSAPIRSAALSAPQISESLSEIESLYEDETFASRQLAALVAAAVEAGGLVDAAGG